MFFIYILLVVNLLIYKQLKNTKKILYEMKNYTEKVIFYDFLYTSNLNAVIYFI